MYRNLILMLLAFLYGCGTASTNKDNWAYGGPDASLKSPPRMAVAGLPPEVQKQKIQEALNAWDLQRHDALEAAKDGCARSTGESSTPDYLLGYSDAFMACMKAQGWTRVSNPL